MFLNRRHYLLFVVNGAKVKSTTVDDLFLGVLRQNELSSCFIALKKYPLGLVCLHRVCFFSGRANSIPYLSLLTRKRTRPMLQSLGYRNRRALKIELEVFLESHELKNSPGITY